MIEDSAKRSTNMRKKLNIGPLPEQVDQYQIDEKLELRWDRIALAGALALALIWAAWAIVHPNAEPASTELTPQLGQQPEDTGSSTRIVPDVKEPANETSQDEQLAQAINELPAPAAIAPKQPPLVTPQEKTVDALVPNLADAVSAALILHDKRVAEGYVRSVGSTFDTPKEKGNRIAVPKKGILKMELHAVLKSQQGQELYHQWFRNGKLQAKIRITATTPEHASFSSKYINQQMRGDWQAKVVDAQGYVLAQAAFAVY